MRLPGSDPAGACHAVKLGNALTPLQGLLAHPVTRQDRTGEANKRDG